MSAKQVLSGILTVVGVALIATGIGAAIGIPLLASQAIGTGLLIASSVLLGPSVPKMPASLGNGGRERLTATLDVRSPRKILFGGPTAMATDLRR